MLEVNVLYSLLGEDGSKYVELKRREYRDDVDKSKYVSWFRVRVDGIIDRLEFRNMSGDIRNFNDCDLIISGKGNKYISDRCEIKLVNVKVEESVIKSCLEKWERDYV
tara:strand:- start:392 stop:715 length:324 start_codon:yes stop_codon:yes gene_type:complete